MPKGVQRSNKEAKKPKQPKKVVLPGAASSATATRPLSPPTVKKK